MTRDPIHPGETLREDLEALGMSAWRLDFHAKQGALWRRCVFSSGRRPTMNDGGESISLEARPSTAARRSAPTGTARRDGEQAVITSVRLKNFKNFADETLRLGPSTVIVGANASGKNNIRDAFRFLHGIGRVYCCRKSSVGATGSAAKPRGSRSEGRTTKSCGLDRPNSLSNPRLILLLSPGM